ncbi:MAG: hypothetical protein ACP6KW_05300 [Candidatus Thorarchaeota archaeon]
MGKTRNLMVLVTLALALSVFVTPSMGLTSVPSVWTGAQVQGSLSWDYYEEYPSFNLFEPTLVRHIGRIDVTYYVKYISNDDGSYDYYSIAVKQTVTPARAMTGNDYDVSRIYGGVTYFTLKDDDLHVRDILPHVERTGRCYYGIGCTVGNGEADFVSHSYLSVPDVYTVGYRSDIWYCNNWAKFECQNDAVYRANTYRWTVLIRAVEGGDLHVELKFKTLWFTLDGLGFGHWIWHNEAITIQFDGTPPSGGGGGGDIVFNP